MGTFNVIVIDFVLRFILCTTPSYSQVIPKLNLNIMFVNFETNFMGCHIKYFFEDTVNYAKSIENSSIIVQQLANPITVSFEDFSNNLNNYSLGSTNQTFQLKFTSCIIVWYMFLKLGLNRITYNKHVKIMRKSERYNGSPIYMFLSQHNIHSKKILGSNEQLKSFLTNEMVSVLIRGPVFYIDSFQEIFIVCIPCKRSNPLVRFNTLTDNIASSWKIIYSDLKMVYIHTDVLNSMRVANRAYSCDAFAWTKQIQLIRNLNEYLIGEFCVHQLLRKRLNYTISKTKYIITDGGAYGNVLISKGNLKYLKGSHIRWIHHATQFSSFYFISIMEKSTFSALVLLKPFPWSLWMSLTLCSLALFCVTKIVYDSVVDKTSKRAVFESHTTEILIAILATTIDQAVTLKRNINGILRYASTKIVLSIWLVWLMLALQVGMLYKGEIFSFLTNPPDPLWPETIDELVESPFTFITLDHLKVTSKYSIIKKEVLNVDDLPQFSLKRTYMKLQKYVRFYDKSLTQFALDISLADNRVQNQFSNNISRTNLAIIDSSILVNKEYLICRNLMPDNAVSRPMLFPGYLGITPWAVEDTYFQPIFERYLAKLYESGIERKMYSFVLSVMQYSELSEISRQIKNLSEPEYWNPSKAQLLFMSWKGANFLSKISETSPVPISFTMLQTVFIICLGLLMISALGGIYEIIKNKL